ncbi:hypothetical protein [Photobacterium profundum]|nr:hypothetical protein [Photobacterium profundum]
MKIILSSPLSYVVLWDECYLLKEEIGEEPTYTDVISFFTSDVK